ncbi:Gfo/Idh/MocA family oxidoreductase [Candidatus Nitrosopelagicus sp.]|nr:Gfo/Idh/MocA family oxidoreductase [Candidatus Nitrosopelagicus sp.]
MKPLKFGIIGCSRIAKRSVIPAIIKSEFAGLEIIGSRSTDKAKEFAKEFNCEKFGTYEDVISDDSVDVVYISTPISTHRDWAIKASEAGKHVYVEKSSAANFTSARKMVESVKENNVRLMEGFMFRFHPQHQKVKELIKEGKIGEVKSFNGVFGFPAFPDGDIRYDNEISGLFGGGGFLLDSGCYPICASRMIFDEEPISSVGKRFFEKRKFSNGKIGKVDVSGSASLFYENGKTATISYINGSYYQAKYEVWGTDGVISLDRAYSVPPDFTTKVTLQYNTENNWEGRRAETFEIEPKDHFLDMLDTFCMEITGTKKASFNFEQELLKQAKVMEMISYNMDTCQNTSLESIT